MTWDIILSSSNNFDSNIGLVVRLLKLSHNRKSPDHIRGTVLKTCAEHTFPSVLLWNAWRNRGFLLSGNIQLLPQLQSALIIILDFFIHEGVWEGDEACDSGPGVYRAGRATEDAPLSLLNNLYYRLESPMSHARSLIIDFSSWLLRNVSMDLNSSLTLLVGF